MKIGTITFHWATNYGAVLQAYALQEYLHQNNYETEIINYIPFKVKFRQFLSNIKNMKLDVLIKEYRINKFRNRHLSLSKRKYYSNSNLSKECQLYDVYICGSDQIWNEWFVLSSEDNLNLSYYLNFVENNKTRISYAVSFGTDELTKQVVDLVKPELEKFRNISVRENTGQAIVQDMGFPAELVVDPTLLLERESYEKLIEKEKIKENYQLFSYILHNNQYKANSINDYIFDNYFNKSIDKKYNQEPIGMIEWLANIKNTQLVVTNSFHGAIFSIIFNTPFIVVPVENSGMNNRITTLLNAVGLNERMIDSVNEEKIDKLITENINWGEVDEKIRALRKNSVDFIEKSLS